MSWGIRDHFLGRHPSYDFLWWKKPAHVPIGSGRFLQSRYYSWMFTCAANPKITKWVILVQTPNIPKWVSRTRARHFPQVGSLLYCLWPVSCYGGMLFIKPWVIWLQYLWLIIIYSFSGHDLQSDSASTYVLIQLFVEALIWLRVTCCSLEKYRPTWANSMEFCCKDFLELHVRQGFRALSQ